MKRTREIIAAGILLPVLIIFGVTACQLPPFDEGLSLALIATKNMRLETEMGPINFYDNFQPDTKYFYVPSNLSLRDGYIVRRRQTDYSLSHFTLVAGSEYQADDPNGGQVEDLGASSQNMLFFPYGVRDNGTILVYGKDLDSSGTILKAWEWNGSVSDFSNISVNALATGLAGATFDLCVGLQTRPAPAAPAADQNVWTLLRDGTTGQYFEVTTVLGSSSASPLSATYTRTGNANLPSTPAPFQPFSLTNAMYHYDPTSGRHYLSVWDSAEDRYKTYVWDSASAASGTKYELPLSGRVERVLSTGELYSISSNGASVYSASGEFRYRIALGELRLITEYWDASEARYRLAFTLLSQDFVGNDGGEQLYARVYSIPTNELDKLD